jgi:hypothetical protein
MHFHTVGQLHDDDVVLAQTLQVKQGAKAPDLRQQLRPCPALGIIAAHAATVRGVHNRHVLGLQLGRLDEQLAHGFFGPPALFNIGFYFFG